MTYYDVDYDWNPISEREYEANRKALSESFKPNGDTHFDMTLDEYIAKFKELGFEQVLRDEFTHSSCGRERHDAYYIFAHREGWLIAFDTYTTDNGFWKGIDQGFSKPSLNQGELHYNAILLYNEDIEVTGGGGFIDYDARIYGGNHDVREGLSHHIDRLKEKGTILSPWVANKVSWLASQMSVREQDRSVAPGQVWRDEWNRWLSEIDARSVKNYQALPEWVQQMIGPLQRSSKM